MQQEVSQSDERPIWRRIVDFPLVAMVTAILLFAFATALSVAIMRSLPPLQRDTTTVIYALVNVTLVFATYKWVIARLGERRHDDLPARGAITNLGLGLLAGFALFAAVVGVAALVDAYNIVRCCSTGELLVILVSTAIIPGFVEEVLFRGILFRWIEEFAGSWAALVVTSVLFGLAHIMNPNASWFSSFTIAVEAGVLLGGAYMLTRSLWMPIGLHAAWNFAQGYIFDVPVSGVDQEGLVQAQLSGPELLSGGAFGLEASLIALVIATAAGVWLVYLAIKRGELMRPWWVRRRLARESAAG